MKGTESALMSHLIKQVNQDSPTKKADCCTLPTPQMISTRGGKFVSQNQDFL